MLITSQRRRTSFSGSLILLAFACALSAASVRALVVEPSLRAVPSAVVSLAILGFVLGQFRLARERSERLAVRTLFTRRTLHAPSCAFGIAVSAGSRGGPTYAVYASDGTSRAELAEFWSQRGAERALAKLARCFQQDGPSSRRDRAQARVDYERERWQGYQAENRARIAEYYASSTWRRMPYLVAGGLVLYLLGVMLYAWLTGRSL